eukprot:SAG31_NODE_843_length_11551_cov_6.757772_4_plen_108_part_00
MPIFKNLVVRVPSGASTDRELDPDSEQPWFIDNKDVIGYFFQKLNDARHYSQKRTPRTQDKTLKARVSAQHLATKSQVAPGGYMMINYLIITPCWRRGRTNFKFFTP